MKAFAVVCLVIVSWVLAQTPRKTDREHDLLKGNVKNVVVQVARMTNKSGSIQEVKPEFLLSSAYSEKGLLHERVTVEGGLKNRHLYNHDQKGDRTETVIGRDGTQVLNWACKYDAEGNRIEEVVSDYATTESRTVYQYDTNSKRIEATISRRRIVTYRRVYRYNENGDVAGMTEYRDGTILVKTEAYTYEFDAAGNWVKRVTSLLKRNGANSSFEPTSVTHRTITYY